MSRKTTAQTVADELSIPRDYAPKPRRSQPWPLAVLQVLGNMALLCFILATVLMAVYKLLSWVWG